MLIHGSTPIRYSLLASLVVGSLFLTACNSDDPDTTAVTPPVAKLPKNVILMINDGASWATWDMAANWQQGVKANDLPVYQSLPVRLGMTTYPLNTSNTPTNDDKALISYDASKAWDSALGTADPADTRYQVAIAGYKYLKQNLPTPPPPVRHSPPATRPITTPSISITSVSRWRLLPKSPSSRVRRRVWSRRFSCLMPPRPPFLRRISPARI